MTPRDLVLTPRGIRFMGRYFPCSVGRGGVMRDKREGDGATPAGVHRITGLYYRPDRMRRPNHWARPVRLFDLWSDDPADPARYNRLVRAPYPHSHETLRRADPLYDMVLITDWNRGNPVPGRGSAIFVHVWRAPGYPTAGCVALAKPGLAWIARRITPRTRLIIG